MQGRILLIDAVATNRIALNAVLGPAGYRIAEHGSVTEALNAVAAARPGLILTAWSLPDGTAADLRRALDTVDPDREIPVVALAHPAEASQRQAALRAGLADMLVRPVDDGMLRAKLRSLMRLRAHTSDLGISADADLPARGAALPGLADPPGAFAHPDRITVLARGRGRAEDWARDLRACLRQPVTAFDCTQRHAVLSADPPPDAIVVALGGDAALQLLADLRARSGARHAAIIAVTDTGDPNRAATALDLGADDVMAGPFDAAELALRIQAQLRRKHLSDRLRSTVRDGLRAALTDPMTGLYNRRYAIPHLSHTIRRSARTGKGFAVMMADLDHFKRINDIYGHLAGDAVLIEAARRLRDALPRKDVIARIGGEEFLIVMRDTDTATAHDAADRLRRAVDGQPFVVTPSGTAEQITISIGVAICQPAEPVPAAALADEPDEPQISAIMHEADLALYESKHAGRNTVTVVRAAA